MGEKDIERLHKVYRACVDFTRLAELPFSFKVDSGNYETAIDILQNPENEFQVHHPPLGKCWEESSSIFVPDILDCENKIIIEFEEETGPKRTGAHMARKGHGHEGDMDTKRDTKRNEFYSKAGFRVLRIWESHYKNNTWKIKLFSFLMDCAKEKAIP